MSPTQADGTTLCTVAEAATAADTTAAIDAAYGVLPAFAAMAPGRRTEILRTAFAVMTERSRTTRDGRHEQRRGQRSGRALRRDR
ncbi:MAG: aldehyde dehydrogenase family protein [Geodermatophilaceae bacterium]|nr:aldehyde dehydrogenase family protein [Geodermatophilaceae bacterium]